MKRRNADCGKIRRPIKKNKIAEQIGSNTLLYVKFLLLWALVITADFLLEFRFEFLWPFWLLLRSVYDSFKYKGLAFSVLFVCIAITSDLVCLFFIPVQWLFFVASTYVWVQYVWHTDKGICLPTIILWILFIYLEAWIRWKDSRNLPHLDLCRPFAAHCIGYPVVTIGFGFKSYVGYRIRQRKQREVAKDNDFYMQLLQEALPKEESTVLDQTTSSEGGDQQQQKELIVVPTTVPCTIVNSNLSTSSSSTSSSRSDTSHHHHHNHHHHHHHNHQQQQQQMTNSKNAQNHKTSSNSSINQSSGAHANGHVSSGNASTSAPSSSSMNGGLNHQLPTGQNSSKHRKSLDKESSSSNSSFSSSTSSTSNGVTKPNGGGGGGGGAANNFTYHQTSPMLQQGNAGSNNSFTAVTTTTASITAATNTSSSSSNSSTSMVTVSTKECAVSCAHVNGSLRDKDTRDGFPGASTATTQQYGRKEGDRETATGSSSCDFSSPSSGNRPTDNGAGTYHHKLVGNGKQNGHVPTLEQQVSQLAGGMNGVTEPSCSPGTTVLPAVEAKSGRAGRKNRLKQQQKAAEQQQLANSGSTMLKIFATLGLASTVTTTLTTTTSSTGAASSAVNSAPSAEGSTAGPCSKATAKMAALAGNSSEALLAGPRNGSAAAAADASQPAGGTTANKPSANGFAGAPSAVAPVVMVQKVCESCPRLEGDLKKVRAELTAQRQTENEMRQKYDSTTGNLKGCLQKTQKEYDELQNRYQELSNQRQQERQSLQTVERRLGEERRLRQSLEAQLSNERKHRKQAEERISRAECGEACLAKKRQMQLELDKLKHDLMSCEDAKHLAEKQTRSFEQEMRKFELQLRNRESQQNADVLMSALVAMQDKNATLEKNLSAETRVKMDLFSALGGTRRELDIATCTLRAKEKEILDLNAKIVQMLALMPNDSLCLSGPVGTGTGQDGGPGAAMVPRLADAPQLLPQQLSSGLNGMNGGGGGGGGGPGGPGGGGGSGGGQQPSPMSHMVLNGQPLMGPLGGGLGVLTSTMTTVSSPNSVCPPPGVTLASLAPGSGGNVGAGGQLVQMQGANQGNGNCPSGLDPNATVYTPKNNGGMVGGGGSGGGTEA
uniref:Putative macoilin-2 n=1 Tax=Anopheles triannulatus TaxID=58253 RepID=A0A2M4A9E4_9DIPT